MSTVTIIPAKPPSLNLFICTYNCGKAPIDISSFGTQLLAHFTSHHLPPILVLCLQELSTIHDAFIGGSNLDPYYARFDDAVNYAAQKFEAPDEEARYNYADWTKIYTPVVRQNAGQTAVVVYAINEDTIKGVETASVGVGDWELGNKGAAGVRFTYTDFWHEDGRDFPVELTFVSVHLTAMEWEVSRRNQDWKKIVRGLVFSSKVGGDGKERGTGTGGADEDRPLLSVSPANASLYKPTAHLFVAGDFNYRTSNMKPAPNDHEECFPQPHHEPDSPNHYSKLFLRDQLNQEKDAGRTLHGLKEAEVTFPPTYKYAIEAPFLLPDEEMKRWQWAKHRWPSWTDRVLYLEMPSWVKTKSNSEGRKDGEVKIVTKNYAALPLMPTSDHRAVTLEVEVPLVGIPQPYEDEASGDPRVKMPFGINPDWKTIKERAARREKVMGYSLWLTTTGDGAGILVASIVGIVGAFLVLKSMLAS